MFSLTHPDKVFKRETVQVRGTRECFYCNHPVEQGSEAVKVSTRYDGKLYPVYMHQECEALRGWIPVGEKPEEEVFCLAETGEARFGKLDYTPEYGWYCQHAAGNVYNVTHYSYTGRPQ